ncbi:uncharacterized protein N7482_008390 [Penicillium canariense]|uniref:DUF3074 domain-containing protein n=1 Tax=Penicillium canariense TaxID=189055 RepID=A0A9W9HW69_9EURO|nr:uncharacterized protein N7482_008390 [Penicillium canariense]KAJ5157290.1 hypothetical protein N7482_008390 [Penicillium canariense]
MAPLHDALQCLQPTSWDEVPQSPEELREYVRDIFKNSRLIAESLPDPPLYDSEEHHGLGLQAADSGLRVVPSSARVGETDSEITSIQKQWGKPLKMGGPKDNPLGLHVWKLSPSDGKGSWFGRRSIHDGLPFSQWRKKLSTEYEETLKVNRKRIQKGQTPDKCIRGIGAEEKIESIEVKDEGGSVLGQLTVYHVSAQFPKPTAPRDFVAMIITSDVGLQVGGTKQPGRSWIMISKPCDHPDAPHKYGYTRGEYESIELIREIPKTASDATSTSSGVGSSEETKEVDSQTPDARKANDHSESEEIHPVEWIMVTRSDPGGNIPRWMVDKGTPRSIGTDAAKFVNWALEVEKPQNHNRENHSEVTSAETSRSPELKSGNSSDDLDSNEGNQFDSDTDSTDADAQSHHGLIASVTGLINSGLERFAPQAILDYIPHHHQASGHSPNGISTPEANKDEPSAAQSIAPNLPSTEPHALHPDRISLLSTQSGVSTPILDEIPQSNLLPAELMKMTKAGKLTSHEKELAKLAERKREIDAKLETIRSELESLHLPAPSRPSTPFRGVHNDVDSDTSGLLKRAAENRSTTPASSSGTQQSQQANGNGNESDAQPSEQTQTPEPPAHVHKAASHLYNEEAKLLKQLRKVESSQLKVAAKIEARQRKEIERTEKTKSKSEVETLRQEVKDLKKELSKLRSDRQKWVDLVSSLQAENMKLAEKEEHS